MRLLFSLCVILLLCSGILFGQGRQIDSLRQVLKTAKDDTNKVNALNQFCSKLINVGDYDSVLVYASQAITLSHTLDFIRGLEISHQRMVIAYTMKGNYPEALKNGLSALQIAERLGNKKNAADVNNNIGIIYFYQGRYLEALKIHQTTLKTRKDLDDKKGMATSYNWLGNTYLKLGNFEEGIKSYHEALSASEASSDRNGMAWAYFSLGNAYSLKEDFSRGQINYHKALKIRQELNDNVGVVSSYINLGEVSFQLKKMSEAKEFLNEGLRLAKAFGIKLYIKTCYDNLSRVYTAENNYRQALENYKLAIAYRDSLLNEENTKKTVRLEMQYEFDKKEAAAQLEQEKKDAVAAAEQKRQRIILLSVTGFGLLVLGFAVFAYRSFLQKKKANIEISKQKGLIEEKQREILDSIRYARRIQTSLLTNERYIEKSLIKLKG